MNINTLKKIAYDLPEDQLEKFWLDIGQEKLLQLPEHTQQKIALIHIAELEEEILEHHKSFGKFQGLSSGYQKIDELTKGFVGGEVVLLSGRTSHGKTAAAINMAVRIAQKGDPVLFVTLEMTQKELGSRIYHVYKKQLKDLPILFQKNDELNYQDIDKLIENAKNNGAKIVFIDHLHYFTREVQNENADLARISKEIKKNAIRHDIPIVLLCQLRKSATMKKGSEDDDDDIEDIKGASAIGQDTDIELRVRRKKEYPNSIYFKLNKNRNRGHDYTNDRRSFDFNETIITDPEEVTLPESW